MFPFGDNPPLHHQPSLKKPPFQLYDQIQNPVISKHDDPPFFSNFPSPFFDEHELPLNQIFPSFHPKPANPTPPPSSEHPTTKDPPPRRRSLSAAAPRKRTGKKDRHSKIHTAQGIRDRRMRLSLQIARKFFDLQDMLGYDKASKTIEWLFTKSKKAIKELAKDVGVRGENDNNVTLSDGKSESFISECEVVSGIEESCEVKEGSLMVDEVEDDGDGSFEKMTKPRKQAACKPNTRESREKARARARCRTEEKMMGKRKSSPNRGNDLEKVGSSTIDPNFDVGDRERVSAAYAAAAGDYSPLLHPPPPPSSDVGTIEKLLGSSSADYSCSAAAAAAVSCCIDPTTTFMGFLGNWDLLSNDRLNYSNIQASTMAGNPTSIYSDFPLFHQ